MDRVFNFSAGHSGLPLEILQQAQADMINYKTRHVRHGDESSF